ncbi:MAG: hypothetical protein LBU60_04835 [Clostridiales bacterium]|jgi:UDP-N-acetylmuramoyl-tripeptide--D-alanyl-D-alanine ligase|nr:hypothetical protein [Clostridiales bacterium]
MSYIDFTVWANGNIERVLTVIMFVTVTVFMVALSKKTVQMLQLCQYKMREFKTWFRDSGYTYFYRYFFLSFLTTLGMSIFVACFGNFVGWRYLGFLFFVILTWLFLVITKVKSKTPLKFTPRVKRLYFTLILSIVFLVLIFSFIPSGIFLYSHIGILPLFCMPIVLFANFMNAPIEKLICKRYIKKAKIKLAQFPNLKIIGITGSFGKTSAKNILSEILSTRFNVCKSPSSFNTPMGLTKTINNTLNSSHDVLILEMGARYKGDILELVDIARLDFCMIVSVGNMHLDTFGSLEQVLNTKFEIISGLKQDGIAILDGSNFDIRARANGYRQAVFVGTQSDIAMSDNIEVCKNGISFDMILNGKKIKVHSSLFGRHVPHLMTMCCAVAFKMGIDDTELMKNTLQRVQPLPHRLQLIQNNGNLIIDNAFSSNLIGAKNALEVMGQFKDLAKVIITPGIVQQGTQTQNTNMELGKEIAKVCDYAFLVGSRANFIFDGIRQENEKVKVQVVKTLFEAVEMLKAIEGNYVVLFENDLPDSME